MQGSIEVGSMWKVGVVMHGLRNSSMMAFPGLNVDRQVVRGTCGNWSEVLNWDEARGRNYSRYNRKDKIDRSIVLWFEHRSQAVIVVDTRSFEVLNGGASL